MGFLELQKAIQGPPGHEPVIGRRHANLRVAHQGQQAIKTFRRPALEPSQSRIILTDGQDYVEAIFPLFQKLGNQGRRMLQIRVHHDHGVPAGMLQTGGQGRLMAEITAKRKKSNPPVARCQGANYQQRSIPRAIVHINDFRLIRVFELIDDGNKLPVKER